MQNVGGVLQEKFKLLTRLELSKITDHEHLVSLLDEISFEGTRLRMLIEGDNSTDEKHRKRLHALARYDIAHRNIKRRIQQLTLRPMTQNEKKEAIECIGQYNDEAKQIVKQTFHWLVENGFLISKNGRE